MVDLTGARSQQVFCVFAYSLLAGVLLLVPAYPAASIVSEKNRGTLALLLNSPMKPGSIFLGKMVGSLAFALLIVSTSLPAAAACYAMGGIDPVGGFLQLYAVLLLLVVQYTALALLVSTFVQSTDAGSSRFLRDRLRDDFLITGPPLSPTGTGRLASLPGGMDAPSVSASLGHADGGARRCRRARVVDARPRRRRVLFRRRLAQSPLYGGDDRPPELPFVRSLAGQRCHDRRASFLGRAFRRLVFVIDPQRRKSGIPFFVNPITVKEFRCRRFGRSHWLIRLIALCAVTSLLITFGATTSTMDWGVEMIGGLMVLLQVVLVVLLAPSLAAGIISSERETGGWDLLRMTPLSAFAIIRGKLFSVAWTLLLVLAATLPGYLVMIYIKPVIWLQVSLVLVCLLLTASLTLLVSAAVSSLFARTATATTVSYIVLIVLFLGPLLIWLGREQPFGHRTVQMALMANPMGAALAVMQSPGFVRYELLPASWWISGIASFLLLVGLCVRTWRLTRPL